MGKFVFVDSEINEKGKIVDLGAVSDDGASFHAKKSEEFKNFLRDAEYVAGHNIFAHDSKYIGSLLPAKCHIIDTLLLSPLLFPNRPYHKLLKDDKIESDDVNNPLSDSIKCKTLFYDGLSSFNTLPKTIKDIYGMLLAPKEEFASFFAYVSWRKPFLGSVERLIRSEFKDRICTHADLKFLVSRYPVELAYALALLTASDKKSITPGWVFYNYPNIQYVIKELRSKDCHDPNCPYCSKVFSPKTKLFEFFGYKEFRVFDGENLQEKAVNYALEGKSILTIFPTGGGKSLTFQLPALIEGEATRGLTVVISPLQSLMKDQVDNLESKSIVGAVTLNGLLSPIERAASIELIRDGTASIVYIAPESLRSKTVEKLLISRHVARFVIDEAHCFSSWGQDFRVDYLFIANFIKSLQEKKGLSEPIPVSCFTATAKPKVISDICDYFRENLGLELSVLATSATRHNLQYKVLYLENDNEKYQMLRTLLNAKRVPTIVYASRVATTVRLAERLSQDGISALPYNGQMERQEKINNQNLFMENKVQVIVATSAFGMGVDKSDVQLIVHYNISDSLESYVQEAGRAGRDQSLQAECYILFNNSDLDKHFNLLNQTKITINEIQQVWRAVKSLTSKTRHSFSASALEIARRAGWDDGKKDVETRIRGALAALEKSGYIVRKMNSPHVYATGILVENFAQASKRIDDSPYFSDEKQKDNAKRIIKRIISARSIADAGNDEAESRIDYISDSLGIPKMEVLEAINSLRHEKILADSVDLYAYIRKAEESKTTNVIAAFSRLERYMLDHIFEGSEIVDLKEFNDQAIRDQINDASVKNMKLILFYWSLKEFVKCQKGHNAMRISLQVSLDDMKKRCEKKLALASRAASYLFARAQDESQSEELIQFSLLQLEEDLKAQVSLLEDSSFDTRELEDALLYLNKIGAIQMEGGFIVSYNTLNVERIVTDNHIQYKIDDYKELANFYKLRVQQIHLVGEFANMMLRDYDEALLYVKEYFSLDYEAFLKKYFKGRARTGEIMRSITPERYQKLFGDLSPIQKEIIDDEKSQYISVLAGPGSGKTRVLVHKLASLLLLEDIKSEQLLMLTFSRLAAREFKSRLVDLIGDAASYVDIKTFHSYCFDLLGKVGNEDEFDTIVKVASAKIAEGEVEEEKITKSVLVIDEAQDIDEDEYNLLQALIHRNPEMKVIAVGDDDQNIYEFRGSDAKYLSSLIIDYGATKYEMVENYRSKKAIVALANRFARGIKSRIKSENIVSMSSESGHVSLVRYASKELEIPLCNDLLSRRPKGKTAVLTISNESALKANGILNKRGISCKLIQSDDGLDLYNLLEFRYFVSLLEKCASPIIDDASWNSAKESLKKYASTSALLPKVLAIIETFEQENKHKYRNDFLTYLSESSFADFESAKENQILISTIHKAKGREFDNVFLLIDSKQIGPDEEKRRIYVGLTRAKTNLYIHTVSAFLEKIVTGLGLPCRYDDTPYEEPKEMDVQLGYRDINLGFFYAHKKKIMSLRPGTKLETHERYLSHEKEKLCMYSRSFQENFLAPVLEKGYAISSGEIRYIAAWKDIEEEEQDESAIILPNIHLIKILEPGENDETNVAAIVIDTRPDNDVLIEEPQTPIIEAKEKAKPSSKEARLLSLSAQEIEAYKKSPLFIDLSRLRLKLSKEKAVPAFFILTDKALIDIVIEKPKTLDELGRCYGIGKEKIKEFGQPVLDVILSSLRND